VVSTTTSLFDFHPIEPADTTAPAERRALVFLERSKESAIDLDDDGFGEDVLKSLFLDAKDHEIGQAEQDAIYEMA
jgi:hypothetical protein